MTAEKNDAAVLVTGGASGIGFETARLLVARGRRVFLLDLGADALEEACAALGPSHSHALVCDVTDEDAVARSVEEAEVISPISGLVNCAGIALDRPSIETSVADFRRIVDINLTGTFIVSRAVVRRWRERDAPGAIVNISSISGMTGNKGRAAYGASKGGMNNLTMVMANELGPHGIRVNAVAPGPVDTPLAQAMHTEDVRRQWHERVPQRRYGSPREIASTVAFLLSGDAGYINGQVLAVDGGFLNAGPAD